MELDTFQPLGWICHASVRLPDFLSEEKIYSRKRFLKVGSVSVEVRAGCAERFFSRSLDSSPMFGDRHRVVSLCAAARCVCA